MHLAAVEERERAHSCVQSAEAELKTVRRSREQKITLRLLEEGRRQLEDALRERWADTALRAVWVHSLVEQGMASLPSKAWHIDHPSTWPESEAAALAAELEQRLGETPRLTPQADIEAGLRIAGGGASLDGTLRGLLANRRAIDARLLARLGDDSQ